MGKGRLESVRKEFPKFSKRAAHIVGYFLNVFAEHTHTHTHTDMQTIIQLKMYARFMSRSFLDMSMFH